MMKEVHAIINPTQLLATDPRYAKRKDKELLSETGTGNTAELTLLMTI